jgi:uncharacterized protein YndB with AHSA1/START domain
MTEPLRVSFDVACSQAHAFRTWTDRISTWWPRDHTVSGRAELVVLQGDIGGRIYERTPEGTEHDWGEVTVWDPPERLAYRWHLGADRSEATEVSIRFVARDIATTTVEIEQKGWERLGDAAQTWRARNQAGLASLVPHFIAAANKGEQ